MIRSRSPESANPLPEAVYLTGRPVYLIGKPIFLGNDIDVVVSKMPVETRPMPRLRRRGRCRSRW